MKVIIIGDSSVGKTCLLLRYTENEFCALHMPTIGIDFKVKIVDVAKKRVKLQLWDSAGQERFRTITQSYYQNAMGIILAFDVTSESSFISVVTWMKQIKDHAKPDVSIVLVGNKADSDQRKISYNRGLELASEN